MSEEKIIPLFLGKPAGKLFTREFLASLQAKYGQPHHAGLLVALMEGHELSFHDAVLEMARWKKMEPEYIESKNVRTSEK